MGIQYLFVRFYWTPAPPKLHLPPSTIRSQMFPAYQGAPVFKARSETAHETVQETLGDSEDDEDNKDKLDPEDVEARQRWAKKENAIDALRNLASVTLLSVIC